MGLFVFFDFFVLVFSFFFPFCITSGIVVVHGERKRGKRGEREEEKNTKEIENKERTTKRNKLNHNTKALTYSGPTKKPEMVAFLLLF